MTRLLCFLSYCPQALSIMNNLIERLEACLSFGFESAQKVHQGSGPYSIHDQGFFQTIYFWGALQVFGRAFFVTKCQC